MGRHDIMTRQVFHVEHYWKVIVYYNLDFEYFDFVVKELRSAGASKEDVSKLYKEMRNTAKAVTFSNTHLHTSIVIINPHVSDRDFMDSVTHEAEHVKQAMLYAYNVEDRGEPPAYTIGYLIGKMYMVFGKLLCRSSIANL